MRANVKMVCDLVDGISPFDTADAYDNAGLLLGCAEQEVKTVLVALDVTQGVIEEAKGQDAQLIIAHHPLLFLPRRDLREEDREGTILAALIRAGLALIAAHTNWDKAEGGVNDALLAALGLPGIKADNERALTRTLALSAPVTINRLAGLAEARLGDIVRRFIRTDADTLIRRLTVCAGAGGEYWPEARAAGADCFLTGECKLHHALEAMHHGLTVLEAGHCATERPGVRALRDALQSGADAVQYPLRIIMSSCAPYV